MRLTALRLLKFVQCRQLLGNCIWRIYRRSTASTHVRLFWQLKSHSNTVSYTAVEGFTTSGSKRTFCLFTTCKEVTYTVKQKVVTFSFNWALQQILNDTKLQIFSLSRHLQINQSANGSIFLDRCWILAVAARHRLPLVLSNATAELSRCQNLTSAE